MRHDKRQHGLEPACIGIDVKRQPDWKSQKIRPKCSESRPPGVKYRSFPLSGRARRSPPLPKTPIHLKILIFVEKKIMKNYGMPFKNTAIDKLGDKFGKDKPQTTKPVTVRPSAEQVSRVKGRMESDINRMDAETHGYERGASSIRTGWSFDQESMENERKDTQDSFFDYHASPYKGKNMNDTRSVYQASKKANEYAKGEYDKSYNKAPMRPLFPKESVYDRKMKIKK